MVSSNERHSIHHIHWIFRFAVEINERRKKDGGVGAGALLAGLAYNSPFQVY